MEQLRFQPSLSGTTFLDYFGYLLSGYFPLLAFVDFFFWDHTLSFIMLGFILSILIYGICYSLYEANLEEGKRRKLLKKIRSIFEGNSYWEHMEYIAKSTCKYTKKYENIDLEKRKIKPKDIRLIFNAYKIWEDIQTKGVHEPAHNMASFYWLFSTCSFGIFTGLISRFFYDMYNLIFNCNSIYDLNWQYYILIPFIMGFFRYISKRIAIRINEFDDIVISYGFSEKEGRDTFRRLTDEVLI